MKTIEKKDFGIISRNVVEISNEETWTIKQQIVSLLRENTSSAARELCSAICKALNFDTAQIVNAVKSSAPSADPFADLLTDSADDTELQAVPTTE